MRSVGSRPATKAHRNAYDRRPAYFALVAYPERMKTKVCLVGDGAVGKTSMIRRFVVNEFQDRYVTTLGAKVSKKELVLEETARGPIAMDITIWDIMGEKGFRDLLKEAYFQGAQGILAVCDLTRHQTLKELDDWVSSVFQVAGEVPVVFAVNKVDLKDETLQLYGDAEVKAAAAAFHADWMYTSAKTGENVENAFAALARHVIEAPGRSPR